MHNTVYVAIAIVAVLSMATTGIATTATVAQTQTTQEVEGSFANVQTVQDAQHIVITVTKAGAEPPEGPVVIIPEEPGGDGNGTIVIPEENQTDTDGNQTDVIVIEPDGNVTQVEGNVTNIDNSTVVIAPENQTVTETDGGVIVVDPPVCECPSGEEPIAPSDDNATTTEPEPTPPLVEEPVTNDTILVPAEPNDTGAVEPTPVPEEPAEGTGGNVTVNGGDNESEDNSSNPLSDILGLQ